MADEKPAQPVSITGEEAEKAPRRPRNLYGYVRQAWKVPSKSYVKELAWPRQIAGRRGPSFVRVEHPLRIDRARELGYRAKPGYVVVRARVRRGGLRKHWPLGGRHPKRRGMNKITMGKSIQRIAEERVSKRHPNLEVLNTYWVGEAGRPQHYEVILAGPHHRSSRADPQINRICEPQHRARAL